MTDEKFKEFLKAKAKARKEKIARARELDKIRRHQIEEELKSTIKMVSLFREYSFIVLRDITAKRYETIYPDDSYEKVKKIIEQMEAEYNTSGELRFILIKSLKLT